MKAIYRLYKNYKMTEKILSEFFQNGKVLYATQVLEKVLKDNHVYTGLELTKWFLQFFPSNQELLLFLAIFQFNTKSFLECFKTLEIIKDSDFGLEHMQLLIKKQCECITFLRNEQIFYNEDIIKNIKIQKNPIVTFTITTCKRYDLFEKTMNSFLNCCTDLHLIGNWFCIDDNSSEEDRKKMKQNYPFLTFYFKNQNEKGHCKSMNIIREIVNSPYIFHMEDDWQFFIKDNYITKCLEVLNISDNIGQCLINKNYSETEKDWIIGGGQLKKLNKNIYYIHEHNADLNNFYEKYGHVPNCAYWKHFSFRPSLLKRSIYENIGIFNENSNHFEMEYAERYTDKGYISAFLPGIYSLHIGRLTSERNDATKLNAYDLNNENQFGEKKKEEIGGQEFLKITTYVVNLDRRQDRWDTFIEKNGEKLSFLDPKRYSAIDGLKLKPNKRLQKIFEGNDYNMRAGIVGCALTHINLYIDLLNSQDNIYCIFEDDIEVTELFKDRFIFILKNIPSDWDICFLGYTPKITSDSNEDFRIIKTNTSQSICLSYGGTFGYMINKNGCSKLLNFINQVGMTNAIDTMQQRSADYLNVYYSFPSLVKTDCYIFNQKTDTDIQNDFTSLNYTGDISDICERLKIGNKYDIKDIIIYN